MEKSRPKYKCPVCGSVGTCEPPKGRPPDPPKVDYFENVTPLGQLPK